MRLILSRKGFDSTSGGCPSPIFPDGSLLPLPIPDKRSPIRYCDLRWRDRDVGDLVFRLTRGRQRPDCRAHVDPDIRRDVLPRASGWRPSLGQLGVAQGHLRRQGVGPGDLFLFWGLFRRVDTDLKWTGSPEHHIWGWMQVDRVVNVDSELRRQPREWAWAAQHPHVHYPPDRQNTLYVGRDELELPDVAAGSRPGHGVFGDVAASRRLTREGARSPLEWSLPADFLPARRRALTYHDDSGRWSRSNGRALLRAASRGQEFVLDLGAYPGVRHWIGGLIAEGGSRG